MVQSERGLLVLISAACARRGNIVMKGYLKDEVATEAAFDGGWFHSGDLVPPTSACNSGAPWCQLAG